MNILLTNVQVNGVDLSTDGITDVMVFADRLKGETLRRAYAVEGSITFDEVSEVPDCDVGYYLYSPCWLSDKEVQRAKVLARQYKHQGATNAIERQIPPEAAH